MARMSREFSLVLLGAGLLTSGYFLMPEDDPAELAARNAEGGHSTSGGSRSRRYRTGHVIVFYGAPGATARPFASTTRAGAVSRGGFGRAGAVTVGG